MTEARLARMAAAAEIDEQEFPAAWAGELVAEVRRLRAAILAVERLDCCHSHLYDRGEGLRRLQDELRADVDASGSHRV